jgi:hypothetical protein
LGNNEGQEQDKREFDQSVLSANRSAQALSAFALGGCSAKDDETIAI